MFYAESNRYGNDTMTEDNSGRMVSAGNLMRFETRADRAAWIESGDENKVQEITRSDARRYHPGCFSEYAEWVRWDENDPEVFVGCRCI